MLVLCFTALGAAVVLDRIAVTVGKHAIKESDIDRDLRLTEFLNREPLNLSPAAKRQSAERLIDQEIIRQEIITGGYRRPSEEDAEGVLTDLRRDRFAGSDARLRQALVHYGLTESELLQELLWQLTVLRFIDQRFRLGVLVTEDEIHAYYDQHASELRREYPGDSTYESLAPKIRTLLEGERVNQNFDQWLKESRNRYQIEYKQGAFQ